MGEPPPGDMEGDTAFLTTAEHPAAEVDMTEPEGEPTPAGAGPAYPPGWAGAEDASGQPTAEELLREEEGVTEEQPDQGAAEDRLAHRAVAGPARPPPELLAAAAEVHQAVCHPHTPCYHHV